MFVIPVFYSNDENEPVFFASSLSGLSRNTSGSRSSITSASSSSSASSVGLRRSSSVLSSKSSSTNASSVESTSPKSRLGRSFSNSSFHAQRRLQKRSQKQQVHDSPPIEETEYQEEPEPELEQEPTPVPSTPTTLFSEVSPRIVTGGSDLLIRCRHDVYHVDRDIMCYFSRWFKTVCAVVPTPKASKTVIDLGADDPDAVAAMIQYCYQLDYTDQFLSCGIEGPDGVTLRSHILVFMLAERYGVTGLKEVALQKFENLAATVFNESGHEEQLSRAIRIIYASGRIANADALRLVIIQLCASHVEAFISGIQRTMAIVFESMDQFPEFRADLFEEMATRSR